MNRASLDMYFI